MCHLKGSAPGEARTHGLLVEVSGHKLESSQTRVFVLFSTLGFLFYKKLFMNRLEFSCFTDYFMEF